MWAENIHTHLFAYGSVSDAAVSWETRPLRWLETYTHVVGIYTCGLRLGVMGDSAAKGARHELIAERLCCEMERMMDGSGLRWNVFAARLYVDHLKPVCPSDDAASAASDGGPHGFTGTKVSRIVLLLGITLKAAAHFRLPQESNQWMIFF